MQFDFEQPNFDVMLTHEFPSRVSKIVSTLLHRINLLNALLRVLRISPD